MGAYGRRTYRREPTYLLERAPRTCWREPTYLLERAHVPTGESPRTYRREPTYLLEREPTYLLERAHVPTGESPRTYRREPTYLLERNHHLTSCSGKDCRHVDFTEDWKKTQTTERVCRMTTEHSGGPPL